MDEDTPIYVDASALIALGNVGDIELLSAFDGRVVLAEPVIDEVTTEPAGTNVERFYNRASVEYRPTDEIEFPDDAFSVLDETEPNGDVYIIGEVLRRTKDGSPVGVVSDDRRVRTVSDGLGATVTGTIGVVVRNVADGQLTAEEAKKLVQRIDSNGLHMTGELREKAYELIDDAV